MFKVLSVKYLMAYHFIGPDGPINMASTNPLLSAKKLSSKKHSRENQNFAKKVISDLTAFSKDKEPFS